MEKFTKRVPNGLFHYIDYDRACRVSKMKDVEFSNGTAIKCSFKEAYFCHEGLCWSNENCINNNEDPEWIDR